MGKIIKDMFGLLVVFMILVIIALVFVTQGVQMQGQVAAAEDRLHTVQAEYWDAAKADRDAALPGSTLQKQLVEIQQTPSALLELKLVGVGKILTGIFVILFAILFALIMVPIRLKKAFKEVMSEHRQV